MEHPVSRWYVNTEDESWNTEDESWILKMSHEILKMSHGPGEALGRVTEHDDE